MKLIDLSQPVEDGMPVYPGDSGVRLKQTRIYGTDHYSNHRLETEMHAGTHVDGPMHMLDVNKHICDIGLEHFCGKGCIIRSHNESIIRIRDEYPDIIKGKDIVLLHTGMDSCYGKKEYYLNHPVLDMSFCEMLASNNIKMVGFDMPSPDRFPFEAHKYLLSHRILILENLTNLDKINDGESFELMAFPIKVKSDSCMVRAVAGIL
ncbi:kynurenine formamidase [Ruminiclostridium sufflavum DSM 19573]|uniref:Kynurenine formamidase n=1 Tax=Ruminiclostridium sufflavum DSM 19573 TaxID=1121337 RepID=A0A318XK05_9FIRM|nr:cyclase family protein [Ruminiclostridium sufflavum]PYG86866.1 kynurenine formamidase [Ruminiclostridium sufflavum DSM 19573]